MIQLISQDRYIELSRLLTGDSARCYFVRLGLVKPDTFRSVYAEFGEAGELKGLLCLRLSGVLQFYAPGPYDVPGFAALMNALTWTYLISPQACCAPLIATGMFSKVDPMAWIARLDALRGGDETTETLEILTAADLPAVDALYDRVFDHHMPLAQVREKLAVGRGRGVVIRREGSIAAAAQSEFEEAENALIVGVATAQEYRRLGLAESCLRSLCRELLAEGKGLWLQYDNPEAGKLYEKLGFVVEDRVMYCWK